MFCTRHRNLDRIEILTSDGPIIIKLIRPIPGGHVRTVGVSAPDNVSISYFNVTKDAACPTPTPLPSRPSPTLPIARPFSARVTAIGLAASRLSDHFDDRN